MMIKFPIPPNIVLPGNITYTLPNFRPGDSQTFDRALGSLVGLTIGDALGASVKYRPRQYLISYPVRDMQAGGSQGLKAGQWTDNTSMALCLASSLLTQRNFNPYDQMVRYLWWYKFGYLSSTGYCFNISNATRDALEEFSHRQKILKRYYHINSDAEIDQLPLGHVTRVTEFDINCGTSGVATNNALVRLASVPIFYYRNPETAVELSGQSARLTHGDPRAIDACRYLGALIVAAVRGEQKNSLLSNDFYSAHQAWFGSKGLHEEVYRVSLGSYKQPQGYEGGIRCGTYIIKSLEAALWAFWNDGNSFQIGVLNVVNLGDDTDSTAAIYGQLAGAYYGRSSIPIHWTQQLYAAPLIECIGQWLYVEAHQIDSSNREQIPVTMQMQAPTLATNQQGLEANNQLRVTQQKTFDIARASVETLDPYRAWRYLPSPRDMAAGLPSNHNLPKTMPSTSTDWRTFPQTRFNYIN
ncbi:unnamed protein product [Rotaria magnacalcarata]|uniref:ADP-ribosylglycohydrolase n=1 Tax=Rotaria magnacalcarata TaxID=392030 RepID=A0A818WMH7_9BILA|nr:unnamed protein product [Rotaria magnacalcarata]CAF2095871.1 unnamed protein product [Rotaria magnacalcarata]CAF3728133.1 unnamed protein product [Rotaria magnacalcarata]CAF3862029.1 unnamed protein product [Rotaria magnacalcarata]